MRTAAGRLGRQSINLIADLSRHIPPIPKSIVFLGVENPKDRLEITYIVRGWFEPKIKVNYDYIFTSPNELVFQWDNWHAMLIN